MNDEMIPPMGSPGRMTLSEFIVKKGLTQDARFVPHALEAKCEGPNWEFKDAGTKELIVAFNNASEFYHVFKQMGQQHAIHSGRIREPSETLYSWSHSE